MTQPRWLAHLEKDRKAGVRGFILTGNTNDLVYYDGSPFEPCSLKFFLLRLFSRQGYEVYTYSFSEGLQCEGANPKQVERDIANPYDLGQVLRALSKWLRQKERRIAFIVDHVDHLCPLSRGSNASLSLAQQAAIQTFYTWATDGAILEGDNLILLISHENQVNDLLVRQGSGYSVIHVELPDISIREQFAQYLLQKRNRGRREFALLDSGLSPADFAHLSSGLPLRDIARLFRQCAAENIPVSRAATSEIKMNTIRQLSGGLLEVLEPSHGLNQIGGLKHLKDYIENLAQLWSLGATSVLPQSILLVGPPGCGKSFSVQAIAHALQLPCVVMRNIREQWVGASERNLEMVLNIIETLAPCIVWIDEVDQALGQRTTGQSLDAGTSERMMGRLWEFMGGMEHRGRILWVATTNRPDLLDAATVDRFTVRIPLLHPTHEEVIELIPRLGSQLGRQLDFDPSQITLPSNLHLPTVRALQEVVAVAAEIADLEMKRSGVPIRLEHFQQAAQLYTPNYNPQMHELLALIAVQVVSRKDHYPWHAGAAIPDYMEDLLDAEGNIEVIELNKRIRELQSILQQERFARQV